MGHFAYTRAPGGWISLSVLFASEMEDIDGKLFKAINGDEGGSWSPSAQIVLGGAGLKVNGPVEGTWTPATQISVGGAGMDVTGPFAAGNVTSLIFTGSHFAQWFNTSNAAFHDTSQLVMTDASTLHLELSSSFVMDAGTEGLINAGNWHWISVAQSLDSASTVADASTVTRTGPTILSGNSAAQGRRYIFGNDADQTFVPSQMDCIHVPHITADRTYTLNPPDNNIKCDCELFWYYAGSAPTGTLSLGPSQAASVHDLTIVSSTGSVSFNMIHNPATVAGDGISFYRAKFHFDGTDWKCVEFQHP